jgi:hypothetical protein
MATIAEDFVAPARRQDVLSGTPRAGAIDRWIYVFTAASFILITFTGFIPDSLDKIAAVKAGLRPPFPLVLHFHAVLMGSFLLLLFAQTFLMATGRSDRHRRLGRLGILLAPALVLVGFVLVPTIYHSVWNAAHSAPGAAGEAMRARLPVLDDIMLLQFRIGILFPLLLAIGLGARARDPGLHKRMMILATAMALPAAIDRIAWLPTTLPASPLATDLYTLLAVSPMLLWDVARNGRVHRAYAVWIGAALPVSLAVYGLWDTPWWHATAPRLMGL